MGSDVALPPTHNGPKSAIEVGTLQEAGSAWDEFVAREPGGTFFHLSGWQRAVERTFGYPSHCLAARRDGRLAGVLPLFQVPTLPWGSALVSAPQAVYGGPVADADESRDALLKRARFLGEKLGVRYIEYRNLAPLDGFRRRIST